MIIPPLDMPVRGVPTRHAAHTLPCQSRGMPGRGSVVRVICAKFAAIPGRGLPRSARLGRGRGPGGGTGGSRRRHCRGPGPSGGHLPVRGASKGVAMMKIDCRERSIAEAAVLLCRTKAAAPAEAPALASAPAPAPAMARGREEKGREVGGGGDI